MGNQASSANNSSELETPGSKRYNCQYQNCEATFGIRASGKASKLFVCNKCKIARYCTLEHQKLDKTNHVGKVCNDLKKARKKNKSKKSKLRRRRNDTAGEKKEDDTAGNPASTDLQPWAPNNGSNNSSDTPNDANNDANNNANNDANTTDTTNFNPKCLCTWLTYLIFFCAVDCLYNKLCCQCCCRCFPCRSDPPSIRRCKKTSSNWMRSHPILLSVLVGFIFVFIAPFLMLYGPGNNISIATTATNRNSQK
jgi:hypothetical protein